MESETVFYKMRLVPSEEGLEIITSEFVSIHETPCFHFCIPKLEKQMIRILKRSDESALVYSRRKKILKRVSKTNSRFAFDSKEKALKHLKFLKTKQLCHMRRDILFIEKLLSSSDDDLTSIGPIPDTKELVREYFVFD